MVGGGAGGGGTEERIAASAAFSLLLLLPSLFHRFFSTIKILLRECTSRNLLPLALPSASPSPLPGSPRVGQRERERKQKFFASLSFSLSILGARIQNSVEKKKKGWCGLYSVSGLGFFQFGGIKGVKRVL